MNTQSIINELKNLGYSLYLEGRSVRYKCYTTTEPPKEKVITLLSEIKNHKSEVIAFLKDKKYCTWLERDIPADECLEWCYQADRTPSSTCKYFMEWWKEREKQLKPREKVNSLNDILKQKFMEVLTRLNQSGKELFYSTEAEDRLNQAWIDCLSGKANMDSFEDALKLWERAVLSLQGGVE